MEQKKQLLIKVLKKLQPYWNLAEGLLVLMESSYADEKTVDGLLDIMLASIKTIKNDKEKTELEKGITLVQNIKKMENTEKISEKDLDKTLDAMMQKM